MKQLVPIAALLTTGALALAALLRSDASSEAVAYVPPASSSRTSAAPPRTPDPPSLPDGADSLAAIRFTVTTMWVGPQGQRRLSQQVTRAADRIHLAMEGTRKEWLLEQNPLDPRRVSGYLVDHDVRQVLEHQESDLRHGQQLRGWADALTMRFDPAVLSSLRRTTQEERVAGATFTRYLANDMKQQGVIEVWWSHQLLLPLLLRIRHQDTVSTSSVTSITPLDQPSSLAVLSDPRTRFPEYEVLDIADTHERRH